jgi:hypothetical protein
MDITTAEQVRGVGRMRGEPSNIEVLSIVHVTEYG